MSKSPNRRLSPTVLGDDETAFNALLNMKDYKPANPAYSVDAISHALDELRTAQVDEDQGEAAQATRRDISVSKEWAFHNLILGAKEQIIAQYGKDSTQVQEIGLKRKSDYKTRKPKAKAAK
jgi:hypothetical protein